VAKLQSHDIINTESDVTEYIPFTKHVTPSIIGTTSGYYIAVWKIGGRSHEAVSQEDVIAWKEEQNNLLRGIATENTMFWSYVIKRNVDEYMHSDFPLKFARDYDQKYKLGFTEGTQRVCDLYLAVGYRPSVDKVLSFMSKFDTLSIKDKLERQAESISRLDEINRRIKQAFGRRYDATLLTTYEHNGFAYSEPKEFIGRLINGEHRRMPVTANNIFEDVNTNRILFAPHGEVGEIRLANKTKYFGMVEIVGYPNPTEPGHLNMLLSANFELTLAQSFVPMSRAAARGFLEKQIMYMVDSNDPVQDEIDAMRVALGQVVAGEFVLGEHHSTIVTYGKSVAQVRDQNADLLDMLSDAGLTGGYVDKALEAGWWSQLPGVLKYRPRPAGITSKNFLGFSSFHNFMSGKAAGNPWGQAVTMLKTVTGSPLYFNFHHTPKGEDSVGKRVLGNTMYIGMSGTGKTVNVGHTLIQSTKYNQRAVCFDKDQGLSVLVRALGGKYFPLSIGARTGWNPLQLELTIKNTVFLKVWLKMLIETPSEPVTHADNVAIHKALMALKRHPIHMRSLSILVQNLPNPLSDDPNERPSVAARLAKWVGSGDYAWIFDNPTDMLSLETHSIYGFDITEFLDTPEIRSPMMMYLLYRTESMIDGTPFQYIFDEYWKPLEDPFFQYLIKNKQKTIRKQNGMNIFASQEPEDALNNPIHATLISQIATFVFLPNPRARKKSYMEGFNLTEREFEIIKGLGEDSRMFLIKQGDTCAIGQLDLSHMEDELLILSGSTDAAEVCDSVIESCGTENPDVWIPQYNRRMKALRKRSGTDD
jgi:type IV secretion system protein VirB4